MIKLNLEADIEEIIQGIRENGGFCPCKTEKIFANRCPCVDVQKYGECICGLYINEE